MRQSESKKRNLIIIGLCAVVAIMAVGFAAFSQQLQINSTSEVTSTWDVHIKNNGVSYKDAVAATSTLAEKTSDLVATFACSLTTPGTSTISYDIIVENKGSLNAKLDSINLTGGNSAISVVTSPTNASLATSPIVLGPDDETTITVTVSYNNINTQPTGAGLSTNITATLNFSQTADSPAPSSTYVYAYHTDERTIGTSVVTDGVSDYTQLSSWSNGKTWFLKYELDGNNVIQNAWSCMKFSFINEPVCFKKGSYGDNFDIVLDLSSTFSNATPTSGACRYEDYGCFCYVGNQNVFAGHDDGSVSAYDDSVRDICEVDGNGRARCYSY